MRRHAKASSAGSTSGTGKSRARFGRAFTTRGDSGDAKGSGARSRGLFALAILGCLAALFFAPAAYAGKSIGFGFLGTGTTGAGAGQLSSPRGIAVNLTGAGGATAGDVYVADTSNRRISVFSASGAFIRAFGRNVVTSGPDNNTSPEVQNITIKADSGKFALQFGGQTTGLLAYNVPASGGSGATASVQNALEALSSIGVGNVTVTGGPGDATGSTPYMVTFAGTLAGKNTEQIVVNNSALGIPVGFQLNCTGGPATASVTYQWLANGESLGSANGAQTSTYTVQPGDAGKVIQCQVLGVASSGLIARQDSAPSLAAESVASPYPATTPPTTTQAALAAPTGTVASGNKLTCATGTWVGSPTFTFQWYRNGVALSGNGANTNQYTIQAVDVASTAAYQCEVKATNAGGSASLFSAGKVGPSFGLNPGITSSVPPPSAGTTITEGSGVEVCVNGVDTCQAGESNAAAGSLPSPQGVAIDQETGNLYITAENSRIDVYSALGKYEGSFGWEVKLQGAAPELQFCTAATECKAGVTGGAAGQMAALFNTVGPAVNPSNGHIDIPDSGNLRVDEYAPVLNGSKEVTGITFLRAIGADVKPTINEKQKLTLTNVTGGTFDISVNSKTTGASGQVNLENGSNELTGLTAVEGAFVAGASISGPGIPAGAKVTAVTFDSLTISAAATENASAVQIESHLPFDAPATTVQAALQALSSVGKGGALVAGSAGGPWTVEFAGALAGENVAPMAVSSSELSGSSPEATVTTLQDGANGTNIGLEVCTTATTCKAGKQLESENASLNVFSSGAPAGLAVDSEGSIYGLAFTTGTCNPERVTCGVIKVNNAGSSAASFAPETLESKGGPGTSNSPTDVAVNTSNDHITVAKRVSSSLVKFYELNKQGQLLDSYPAGPGLTNTSSTLNNHGMALGTAERLYYYNDGTKKVQILAPPPAPTATIDFPSEVGSTTATVSGTVTPPTPGTEGGYETLYQFEYSRDGVKWTPFPAEPVSVGNGSGSGSPNSCPTNNPPTCNVRQVVTGLQPGANYLVRLMATTGTATTTTTRNFTTGGAPPTISGMRANPVEQTSATLQARLNPNNQSTTYHFEWGTDMSYGSRIPAEFDTVGGSSGTAVPVTASLSNLTPNTTYHFRLVAHNDSGTTIGVDHAFTTLDTAGLPDNRAFELISPANKKPVGQTYPLLEDNGPVNWIASSDGERFTYMILNATADSTAGGEAIFDSQRGENGWSSSQVSAPSLIPSPFTGGVFGASSSSTSYFNQSQSCAIVATFNPVTANTPQVDIENGVVNLYRWNEEDGSYTLLTPIVPTNPSVSVFEVGSAYKIYGTSSDCSKVIFKSQSYTFIPGASGLYEWNDGELRDAGKRPDGTVPSSFNEEINKYRVAESGQLAFVANSDQGIDSGKQAVFVRKTSGQVVDASQSITGNPTQGAQYLAASPNGDHVFFTANYGLTAVSSTGPSESCTGREAVPAGTLACDLYDYNVKTEVLKDLSADSNSADSRGAVFQGLMGISNDGTTVYLATKGQLVPGQGRTYAQNIQGVGFANVYRSHNGVLSYVGSLKTPDMATIASGTNTRGAFIQSPSAWTSSVSENGKYMAYISSDSPTGEPQVYLYSAEAETNECASCPEPGAPNVPDGYMLRYSPNGITPLTPSNVSEDGRVFFSANDALTPGAKQTSAKFLAPETEMNVYEFYNGQIALIASGRTRFVDVAGPNGRDVFLRSFERLSPEDTDFTADVYDVRAGGGFTPPPVPPPGCDPAADQCQGQATPAPGVTTSPSSGFTGPGNPPPATVSRHHKRNHQKRHHHKKRRGGRPAKTNRGGVK